MILKNIFFKQKWQEKKKNLELKKKKGIAQIVLFLEVSTWNHVIQV